MEIKILIVGDYCPIGRNKKLLEQGSEGEVFGDFDSYTSQSDFSIANLEAPLTDSNNAIEKSGPNIKASKNTLKTLKNAGFNAVTLANNHIMDFGDEGVM